MSNCYGYSRTPHWDCLLFLSPNLVAGPDTDSLEGINGVGWWAWGAVDCFVKKFSPAYTCQCSGRWKCTAGCSHPFDGHTCAPPPTPTPTLPMCQSHCSKNSYPWASKCNWIGCAGCSECHADPDAAEPEVTQSCKPWCAKNAKPWSKKCKFKECAGCSMCSAVEEATPESDNCKQSCHVNTKPWTKKCGWNSCNKCDQCASSVPTTPSACPDYCEAPAKCSWKACSGCWYAEGAKGDHWRNHCEQDDWMGSRRRRNTDEHLHGHGSYDYR